MAMFRKFRCFVGSFLAPRLNLCLKFKMPYTLPLIDDLNSTILVLTFLIHALSNSDAKDIYSPSPSSYAFLHT